MTWIVLAAGLGANFIVVVLLFRRLRRDLGRQLRDTRAERNSEWILHALRDVPEEREMAAQVANGSGREPEPPGQQPVRRKRHLGLFIGGGVVAMVAMLSQALRGAWRTQRGQLIATAGAVVAAGLTVAIILVAEPWGEETSRPPSSAPTAAPTFKPPHESTRSPTADPSPRTPSVSPSTSLSETAPAGPSLTPSGGSSAPPSDGQGSAGPQPQPTDSPPSDGASTEPGPSGDDTPPPPSTTPPLTPNPSAEPEPTPTPDVSGLCVDLAVMPVVAVVACLLGGG